MYISYSKYQNVFAISFSTFLKTFQPFSPPEKVTLKSFKKCEKVSKKCQQVSKKYQQVPKTCQKSVGDRGRAKRNGGRRRWRRGRRRPPEKRGQEGPDPQE